MRDNMPENDNRLNDNSPLIIYEDQDGALLYPSEKSETNKSRFVTSLYDHKIALLLSKKERKITIYCHIIAAKRGGREIGLYLVHEDEPSIYSFENFKEYAEKLLKELEFNFSDVDDSSNNIFGNNIIFKNIDVFDSGKNEQFYNDDEIYLLKQELSKGERLTYSGGNEYTIPNFVASFLKNIPECHICISSTQSDSCNLNIRTDFRNSDLNPTGNTKIIIERIKKQIKEKEEKKRKEKAEKLKVDALCSLENSIKQLQSRGCNNSYILKYLYSYSLSPDTPIDLFIQILVKSECNINEGRRYSKDDLTNELLKLFKNSRFKSMLDDRFITTYLIERLDQIKESKDPQGLITNESKESTISVRTEELNELDNAIKQLPCQVDNSEIIMYVYRHISSSPIDKFIKTVIDSDIAIKRGKEIIYNDKFNLTSKLIELFNYLSSKNMLDWKLIEKDEYIKTLIKNTNHKNAQTEPKNYQLSNSKKPLSRKIQNLYDRYIGLQGKKLLSSGKKFISNLSKKFNAQTENQYKSINNRDYGKEKKQNEKITKNINAQSKNKSKHTSSFDAKIRKDNIIADYRDAIIKLSLLGLLLLILLEVIILIYFYLFNGTFYIGNFTLGFN